MRYTRETSLSWHLQLSMPAACAVNQLFESRMRYWNVMLRAKQQISSLKFPVSSLLNVFFQISLVYIPYVVSRVGTDWLIFGFLIKPRLSGHREEPHRKVYLLCIDSLYLLIYNGAHYTNCSGSRKLAAWVKDPYCFALFNPSVLDRSSSDRASNSSQYRSWKSENE